MKKLTTKAIYLAGYSNNQLEKMIEHLEDVGLGLKEPYNPARGICNNLWAGRYLEGGLYDCLREAFRTWEFYSGCTGYPVPASNGEYYNKSFLWTDCHYADLRRDLCLHVANEWRERFNIY
jgi:hypothetical protein